MSTVANFSEVPYQTDFQNASCLIDLPTAAFVDSIKGTSTSSYIRTLASASPSDILLLLGVSTLALTASRIVKFFTSPVRHAVNYSLTDLTYTQAKLRACDDLTKLVRSGFEKSSGRPFYTILCQGPTLVLPHTYTSELERKASLFSLSDALNREFHTSRFKEYAPYKQPDPCKTEFGLRIAKGLDETMSTVAKEVPSTIGELWGESPTWQCRELGTDALYLIARPSARVFGGEDLCRNESWLRITMTIAVPWITAAVQLQLFPSFLRPVARYFLPACRQLKVQTYKARKILHPIIERRQRMRECGIIYNDAIEWFEQIGAGKDFDPVHPQVQLVLASVQTTGDFFMQILNNICVCPEIIPDLREEATEVVRKYGSSLPTAALKELHLIDSLLKETMRMKPTSPVIMERQAKQDVTFADGTHIPRDTYIAISQLNLWDDNIYPDAKTFNPRRFLGKEQFVRQRAGEFVPFGYGARSCPGRFFASYQIKTVLVHMLLKYDFEIASDSVVPTPWGLPAGDYIRADDRVKMNVRRRTDEASRWLP